MSQNYKYDSYDEIKNEFRDSVANFCKEFIKQMKRAGINLIIEDLKENDLQNGGYSLETVIYSMNISGKSNSRLKICFLATSWIKIVFRTEHFPEQKMESLVKPGEFSKSKLSFIQFFKSAIVPNRL